MHTAYFKLSIISVIYLLVNSLIISIPINALNIMDISHTRMGHEWAMELCMHKIAFYFSQKYTHNVMHQLFWAYDTLPHVFLTQVQETRTYRVCYNDLMVERCCIAGPFQVQEYFIFTHFSMLKMLAQRMVSVYQNFVKVFQIICSHACKFLQLQVKMALKGFNRKLLLIPLSLGFEQEKQYKVRTTSFSHQSWARSLTQIFMNSMALTTALTALVQKQYVQFGFCHIKDLIKTFKTTCTSI